VIKRILFHIRGGLIRFSIRLVRKIFFYCFSPRVFFYKQLIELTSGLAAVEIGGPSKIFMFKGYVPLYNLLSRIDNVNYSSNTIWEGDIKTGQFKIEGNVVGDQFILEATDLSPIETGKYDLLLSSEMIQHIANPLKALAEWKRILKPCGLMLLVIPDKSKTFDHRRSVTSMSHLVDDFENGVNENDLTHLNEVLKLHDLNRDFEAGSYEAFKKRCVNNFIYRGIHHHCFDLDLSIELLEKSKFEIVEKKISGHQIIILARSI
jgi:SAM-dependent methyltransferase